MAGFATTWIFSYALWMLLSCGNGGSFLGFLPGSELYLGVWVATAAAFLSRGLFGEGKPHGTLSVARFFRFVRYVLVDFFPELAKANLLVAKAVITGKITPGILRVKTHLTRDDALTALANSITLTPGTLSVQVDDATNDLFVHFLNLPQGVDAEHCVIEADALFEVRPCVRTIRKMYGEAVPEPEKPAEAPAEVAETVEKALETPEKAPESDEKPAEAAENAEKQAEKQEKSPETGEKPAEMTEKPAETAVPAEKEPENGGEAACLTEKPAEAAENPVESAGTPAAPAGNPAPTEEVAK
jgi:multicomponent Na+:H+ antiporter subunit E